MNPQKTPGMRITKHSSQKSVIIGMTIKHIDMPNIDTTMISNGLIILNSLVEIEAPKNVAMDLIYTFIFDLYNKAR